MVPSQAMHHNLEKKNFITRESPIRSSANIYFLKVDNRNTKKSDICSRLTIKSPERRQ